MDILDEKLLKQLAFTCRGCFSPLTASLGGIVGQEVLKALTGKYTPLKQGVCKDFIPTLFYSVKP